MVKSYFKGIRKVLLSELESATEKIVVAVYWFTNHDLFKKINEKLEKGVQVEIIIHNDYDSNLICEFDDNDYMFRKSYAFDKMYQPTTGASVFEVQARYVFANSTGTELAVLRKAKAEDNSNWSLEFLKLD